MTHIDYILMALARAKTDDLERLRAFLRHQPRWTDLLDTRVNEDGDETYRDYLDRLLKERVMHGEAVAWVESQRGT